jgi:hypothetical protein
MRVRPTTTFVSFAAAACVGVAEANNRESSTLHFEGALTAAGGGVYTGVIDATAGEYYVPGGRGAGISTAGGFDVYAWKGKLAYVQGMTPDHWPIGSDHDAYSLAGPWGTWYDPDCADWNQYSLELTATHWYLRYTPTGESPMSGTIDWAKGRAYETDLGTQDGAHDGSAAHGGGPQAWDWDCGWGVEVIPLQTPVFILTISDLGGGDYHVSLMPDANTVASSTMVFEGDGTPFGPVVTGAFPALPGTYYVPDGPGELVGTAGGFDLYAKEGGLAYVSSYTPPSATVTSDHDAYHEGGPWAAWYDPDCEDYYNYTLVLDTDTWYLQHTWPTGGKPMGGTMDWTSMYATETDVGWHPSPLNPDDALAHGGGPQAWDCDWTWGSEVIPLEFPGYSVTIETTVAAATHTITLAPSPGLDLSPQLSCHPSGENIVVEINMPDMPADIVGGQFFLLYDHTKLTLVDIVPGDPPFTLQVFKDISTLGVIDYSVHVPLDGSGTSSATTMARATFTAGEMCDATADLVYWDTAHDPPSRLTDDDGTDYQPALNDLDAITVDPTAPIITCPGNITVNADAGLCTAVVDPGTATATDNCSDPGDIYISGLRDDLLPLTDPYPQGTTTITWTATDECGNSSQCPQTVTVTEYNTLVVDVELDGIVAAGPITRCITFELFESCGPPVSVEVDWDVDFNASGLATAVEVDVPCGVYVCITARDKLHTLRRTDEAWPTGDFRIVSTEYVADFTSSGSTNDELLGGNHNDDRWIDILDFGMFIGQWALSIGADTTCGTTPPHADSSGNGTVGSEDYSFIQTQFLFSREADCCGAAMRMAAWNTVTPGLDGPVTRISTKELRRRGLAHLIKADLNHDDWLDVRDMEAFANGARP